MKILFITNCYPTQRNKSEGIFIYRQATALKKVGNEVAILLIDYRSIRKKRKLLMSTEYFEGIKIYRMAVPLSPFKHLIDSLAETCTDYAIKCIFKKFGRPDLVHGHFLEPCLGINIIKRKYGIPIIITEHGSNVYKINRTARDEHNMEKVYLGCDRLIAVSNALRENINQIVKKQVAVIPNVVPDEYTYIEKNIRHDLYFNFISVGHLIPSKRFDLTIDAFNEIHKRYKNTKLVIVGDGILIKILKRKVQNYHLDDSITFKGSIPFTEMINIYRECDCFVLPSEYETFGVVYIEANALGLPVIGYKNGGADEIINSKNGLIIPDLNVKSLANAMTFMIENSQSYDRNLISRVCLKRFGTDKFLKNIMEVYREEHG